MSFEGISAAKTVYDLLGSMIGGYTSDKKTFHDVHIEPLFVSMKEIHRDYTDGFSKVRGLILESAEPDVDAISFLKDQRRDLEFQRIHSADLAEAISGNRRRLSSDFNWLLTEKFCVSCIAYFEASSNFSNYTWYSNFIHFIEADLRANFRDKDIWSQHAIAADVRSELVSHIDNLLDGDLPRRFGVISKNYSKLRVRLL